MMAQSGGFIGGFGSTTSPASQGGSQGGEKKDRISTLTPISVSQIHTAQKEGDGFSLYNNTQLGQVSLVGIIRAVEKKSTKISYTIEDHTGLTECTKWLNEDEESDVDATCRENMYVEVVGMIKDFNDKRSISAYSVAPIDPNQITTHLLGTIFTYLRHTKGPLNEEGKLGASVRPMATTPAAGMGAAQPMVAGMNQYTAQADTAMDTGVEGGNEIQGAVINVVKQCDSDEGVSVSSVTGQLKSKFSEAQVREALEWLSGEGHVYSTIDDDHFKSTDS